MRESGKKLIEQIEIRQGMDMLDLGCGDGTTAIPAAKSGANVLGVDIASNLVAAGNLRAQQEGLSNCKFQEGDACDLQGLNDNSFDLSLSVFGAMFAPKPFEVAKEMVRVTRPGGKIIMGNCIPGDPTLVAQVLKISLAYTPPPPEGLSVRCCGAWKILLSNDLALRASQRRISVSLRKLLCLKHRFHRKNF